MVEFSRYYINFLRDLFSNIYNFFITIINAFIDVLIKDPISYFENLINSSNNFNLLDWISAFIVIIINGFFIIFLFIRLYQLLRKYIKFVKKEIDKDQLLEEITALNLKTAELVEEKNKIFALKVSNITNNRDLMLNTIDNKIETEGEIVKSTQSRFIKLINVDIQYQNKITYINMKHNDLVGLAELVNRFIQYSASNLKLFYDRKIISSYFAGMATSKILILEGISGTGKTSLPYAMGKFFGHDTPIVSVQPSWRDRTEMIGYLNEFTKKFNETDFLKHLYETSYREDLNFIILDEMNLARIEYYFAEFLSILEMPDPSKWKIDLVPETLPDDPNNLVNGKLLIPQNLWFIGTANNDDSTFTITDKVYDRAIAISMNEKAEYIDAPQTEGIIMNYEYLSNLFKKAEINYSISHKSLDNIQKLDEFITAKFKITFGNRIMKQIKTFVPVYVACGRDELEGLDFMLYSKILRKFESLNIAFLLDEIDQLIIFIEKLFGKNTFKESVKFLTSLKKQY